MSNGNGNGDGGDPPPPNEVCAANPSARQDIPYNTRVLLAQDNEENWVVIWAECAES